MPKYDIRGGQQGLVGDNGKVETIRLSDEQPVARLDGVGLIKGQNVFILMLLMVGAFASFSILAGVMLVYLGAAGGQTEVNILGSDVKTANAGVAAIALGALVMLFVFRRVLKALEVMGKH